MFTFFKNFALLIILIIIMVFISAKGPELHSRFIRNYVGTKVVTIMSPKRRSGGTGFLVKAKSGKTYILTNNHVCGLNQDGFLNVIFNLNPQIYKQKIVARYDKHDLCLIDRIGEIQGIDLADSLSIGETIGLIGHPSLQPLTLSRGEFIGGTYIDIIIGINIPKNKCPGTVVRNRLFDFESLKIPLPLVEVKKSEDIFKDLIDDFLNRTYCVKSHYASQLTAYSRGGSSGSPVVNFWGNLVSVLFAGNRQDPHESFSVPLSSIKDFLKDY